MCKNRKSPSILPIIPPIRKTFEEIKEIIDNVKYNKNLGVCLDTCHVFCAGYDIKNNLDNVLDEFDKIIGLDRLKAIHLNDTFNGLKSEFNKKQDPQSLATENAQREMAERSRKMEEANKAKELSEKFLNGNFDIK